MKYLRHDVKHKVLTIRLYWLHVMYTWGAYSQLRRIYAIKNGWYTQTRISIILEQRINHSLRHDGALDYVG